MRAALRWWSRGVRQLITPYEGHRCDCRTRHAPPPNLRTHVTPAVLAYWRRLGWTTHVVGHAVYAHSPDGRHHVLVGVWGKHEAPPCWADRLGRISAGYERRLWRAGLDPARGGGRAGPRASLVAVGRSARLQLGGRGVSAERHYCSICQKTVGRGHLSTKAHRDAAWRRDHPAGKREKKQRLNSRQYAAAMWRAEEDQHVRVRPYRRSRPNDGERRVVAVVSYWRELPPGCHKRKRRRKAA